MSGDGVNRRVQARRGAAIGGLAARHAARTIGTKIAMTGRTERAKAALAEQSALRAADQFVDVLGKLKGGSMKVGQMLSVLDLGILPDGRREEFRERLEALCDRATPVPFAQMRTVIENELGDLDARFAEFDTEPIGVASIGQVYRAVLHDGRDVAVKVQYPGIEAAISSDIRNLKLVGKMLGAQWPGLRDGLIFDEIAVALRRELDYRAEARAQAGVAAANAGHPFFVVPQVIEELCTDRILVTEYIDGRPLSTARELPQAERDRIGELLYRFYIGSLFHRNEFCADPHFGNVLLLSDHRLGFLDYGQYHRMEPADVAKEAALLQAACDGNGVRVRAILEAEGVFRDDAAITTDQCLEFVRDATEWTVTDERVQITTEGVTGALLVIADPRSAEYGDVYKQRLPAVHLLSRKLEFMTMGMVGELEAEANWHRIAREWLYDEKAQTPIGRTIATWAESAR